MTCRTPNEIVGVNIRKLAVDYGATNALIEFQK